MALRQQYVTCGKRRCRCMRGGAAHGPYWYEFTWRGGRTRSRYVGKDLPKGRGSRKETPREWVKFADEVDADTIGVGQHCTFAEAKAAYKRRIFEVHPDKGGTDKKAAEVNGAWQRFRSRRGW